MFPKKYLLIAVFVIIAIAATGRLFNIGGFTTLGLSSVDFQDSGQQWVLTVVQNGAGGYAVGTFANTQIKSASGDKFTVADAKIEVNLDQNYAQYTISNDFDPIYRYTIAKAQPAFGQSADDWCRQNSAGRDVYGTIKPSRTFDSYCIFRTQDGWKGTLSGGSQIFQSTIMVTRLSDKPGFLTNAVSGQINNFGQSSVSLGSVGTVNWAGSLVTGYALPAPSDQDIVALWQNNQQNWITVSRSAFDNWRTQNANLQNCGGITLADLQTWQQCVSDVNSAESSVLQGKTFTISGGSSPVTTGTASSGKFTINLPVQYTYPVLTFRLSASWLGIVVPNGEPQITSAQPLSAKTRTGDTGVVQVDVKNIGPGLGVFDISMSCPAPFSVGQPVRIQVNPGATSSGFVSFVCSTSQDTSQNCNIKARDINSFKESSISTSLICTSLAVCQNGAKRTQGLYVQECQNGGWANILTCPANSPPDPITFQCTGVPPPPCDFIKQLLGQCGGGGGNIPLIIWGIVALVIVALIGLGFLKFVIFR